MRICFVAYDRSNYRAGPIVNLRRLLPAIKARGHEPILLTLYHDVPENARMLEAEGVVCRYRPRKPCVTEEQVVWILEQLAELQPDVFVPNISVQGYYAAKWAREAGIATVGTMRSDDAFYWGVVDEFVTGDPKWALSGLVCVSRHIQERVAARGPRRTQLEFIPSGVPVPSETSLQEGLLRLVYVGRLAQKQKRIRETVEAMCRVTQGLPGTTATLIGEGVETPWIEERLRQPDAAKVRLLGPVAQDDLHAELCRHHVLVLLSDYEGTPGAVMDGMACGLVPVCHDQPGGVRELVRSGETGLVVKDRDDDFVAAIKALAGNQELRKRLATNARRHIEQNYSLPIAADRWVAFCDRLTGETGNSHRRPVSIPRHPRLPRVHPGLSHEDPRQPTFRQRLWRRANRYIRRATAAL